MSLQKEFYQLLNEKGLEVNDCIVDVDFGKTGDVEYIFITDEDQDLSIVGQEGFKTYSAFKAIDFIQSCEALINAGANDSDKENAYNRLKEELQEI